MDLPKRTKRVVPRICDYSLTCSKCGHSQVVASGFVGSAFHENDDLVLACCDKMGWDHDPDVCPKCNGNVVKHKCRQTGRTSSSSTHYDRRT